MKRLVLLVIVASISLLCLAGCGNKIEGYDENFYSNRAGFSYMDYDNSAIYFRNVYDSNKLYKMDKQTNAVSSLSDDMVEVSDIYAGNGCVYFSAWDKRVSDTDRRDIFKYDIHENSFTTLAEAAMSPIISDNFMYFTNDEAPRDIFVKNLSTGEQTTLLKDDDCEFMNIIGRNIYAVSYGRGLIIKYNIDTKEVKEIPTEAPPNRLQYYNGCLYFYTYAEKAAIYRLSVSDDSVEKLANYNDGSFFYTAMLVTDRYIFFLGCKTVDGITADGRGLFRYDLRTKEFKHINEFTGSSMTTYNKLLFLFTTEGETLSGAKMKVVDFDGKEIDSYKALTARLSSSEKTDNKS